MKTIDNSWKQQRGWIVKLLRLQIQCDHYPMDSLEFEQVRKELDQVEDYLMARGWRNEEDLDQLLKIIGMPQAWYDEMVEQWPHYNPLAPKPGSKMTIFTTVTDVHNWVDSATSNWDGRTDDQVEYLVGLIVGNIDYGRDCSEYLDSLPENLADLLPEELLK